MDLTLFSYQKFVKFALEASQSRTTLTSLPFQNKFKFMKAKDDKTVIDALAFQAPKIRLLRSLTIEGDQAMQGLRIGYEFQGLWIVFKVDLLIQESISPLNPRAGLRATATQRAAGEERVEETRFDCSKVGGSSSRGKRSIGDSSYRDLNPLYDVTIQRDYKDKYYRRLMPLGQKYAELLPWGDKLTSESLRFFSPIVLWTKFSSSQYKHDILYSAFVEYFKAWLDLMEEAVEEADASKIIRNCEAQHRYLTWRAEKDPGYPILKKLVGENLARDVVRHFLFEGVDSLGSKTFLDYFPEYRSEDGTINRKRSMVGKSYETRPWDARGEFVGNKPGGEELL